MFPDWFAGVAFAAIGIGALVPAAIMSIAAANLFTRNIYKDFIKPDATPAQETKVSKLVSLLVKVGALAFVLTMDKTVAINFQLLGGIWILQTFPALVGGLFTRWFHRWALLAGWAVGMLYGTVAAYGVACPTQKHFGGSSNEIPGIGEIGYIGLTAFVLNVVVTVVLTFVLRARRRRTASDETRRRTTRRTRATRACRWNCRRPRRVTRTLRVRNAFVRRGLAGGASGGPLSYPRRIPPATAPNSPIRHNMWGCYRGPAQDVCSCSLSPQGNPVRIRNCPATVYSMRSCLTRARVSSPRTCRQRARPTGPGAMTSGPRGVGRWTRRVRRTRVRVLPPALRQAPCRARESPT